MKTTLILIFILLSTIACSTISYDEPTTGALSRVRFATDTEGVVVVNSYSNSACENEEEWMRIRKGFLVNSSPKSLNIPLANYHKNAFKEFYIDTKEHKLIIIKGTSQIGQKFYSCGVPIKLDFLAEGVDFELLYNGFANSCNVTVSKISNIENAYTKIKMQTYINDASKLSNECISVFNNPKLF